ncbi:DNA circularization protein [Sphingomonas sp. TX0522]|uniref:DNA circularization protein n=1 Tax=Sphingomonas sp. TX0522 TaxID=2479205 RepID=UPI0018DF277A|nr:DNA circularization N-terminal domain-containing protein [Sphingomonas sp. TX0522]
MSWRDQYRTGSFRGVAFRSQSNERSGGRRIETHEYPQRDAPFGEDLGRRARSFALEVFVAGVDYMTQRDRLIDALEAAGAGQLVHPWDGPMSVTIPSYSVRDSTEDGGIAFFSIECVEAGQAVEAPAAPDTYALVETSADAAIAAAPARFDDRFDVSGYASFVEDAAVDLVVHAASAATLAGGLQGGAGQALRAFQAGLSLLPSSARALVRSPLSLGQAIVGLVAAIGALGGGSTARIAGLSSLVATTAPVVIGATPARNRQRANGVAFADLISTAAAAELVRAIAAAPIASYQDAVVLRDAAAELLEARIIAAADVGDDSLATTFAELLRVMVADVTARGGTLSRVYGYTPARTEPTLVIAARLYGPDGAMLDRAVDIVGRNRLRHPGFVAGGRPIEVLEVSGG